MLGSPCHASRPGKARPAVPAQKAAGDVVGSWRLVSYRYGDMAEFIPWPAEQVMLKHVTPTHFTWVTYETKTRQAARMAGGTYTLKGSAYREVVEFAMGDDVQDLIGKAQNFSDTITPTLWHHKGTLSNGLKIEEIWERAR